jgi:hypothetical protein
MGVFSVDDPTLLGHIKSASEKYGVPEELIHKVIKQESNYDPEAQGPQTKSGRATGLMQLVPGTAAEMGVTDPTDPEQNIHGGTKYLGKMLQRYGGDTRKALAAYNWGPRNFDRGGMENLPAETANYLQKILGDEPTAPVQQLGSYPPGYTPSEATLKQQAVSEDLARAQSVQKQGGSPDDAARIARGEAPMQLDPKNGSLMAQATPEAEPYQDWSLLSEDQRQAPLVDMLRDRQKAQQIKDDIPNLVKLGNLRADPIPETYLGKVWEKAWNSDERARLAASVVLGTATQADRDRMDALGAREAVIRPDTSGVGGWIAESAIGVVPFLWGKGFGAAGTGATIAGGALGGPLGLAATVGGVIVSGVMNAQSGIGSTYLSIKDLKDENGKGIEEPVAKGAALFSGITADGIVGSLGLGGIWGVAGRTLGLATKRVAEHELAAAGSKAVLAAMLKNPIARDLFKNLATNASTGAAIELLHLAGLYAAAGVSDGQKFNTPGPVAAAEQVTHAALGMAVVGTTMHYPMHAAGKVVQRMVGNAGVGEAGGKAVEAMYDTVHSSATMGRNPELVRDMLKAGGDKGLQSITVPREDLLAFLKDSGLSEEEAIAKLPRTKAALAETESTGGLVHVPIEEAPVLMLADKGKTLKDKIGLGDRPSVDDAQTILKGAKKLYDEYKLGLKSTAGAEVPPGERQGPAQRIFTDILAKTKATFPKASDEAAGFHASLVATAMETMANRSGIDPWKFYMETPLDLHMEGEAPAGAGKVIEAIRAIPADAPPNERARITREAMSAHMGERHTLWGLREEGTAKLPTEFHLVPGEVDPGLEYVPVQVETSEVKSVSPDGVIEISENVPADRFRKTADLTQRLIAQGEFQQGKKKGEVLRGYMRGTPGNRAFDLTLTGNASMMTFIHEGAHFFLEVMRKAVKEGYAGEQIIADLNSLEEWAGVKPGEKWSTEALEKFARGFESYMAEGKAPSRGLARVFETVQSWFLKAYKSLKNRNAPLTDEVRGVMDRMLASDEQIAESSIEQGNAPMKFAGLSWEPGEKEKYLEVLERASRETRQELIHKALAELKHETGDMADRIKADIKKRLDADPLLNVAHLLQAGKSGSREEWYTRDGRFVPNTLIGPMDLGRIREMGLGKRFEKLLVGLGHAAENGKVDPDELAAHFGLSTDTMMKGLRDNPSRTALEKAEFKRMMTAEYPGYGMTPDWLERQAMKAITGDAVGTQILTEIAIMGKRTSTKNPSDGSILKNIAYKAAWMLTREAKYRDLNPEDVRRTAADNAAKQREFEGKQEFERAIDEGRKRLMNNYRWQMVDAAKRYGDRVKDYVAKYKDEAAQARIGKLGEVIDNPFDAAGEKITVGALIRDALVRIEDYATGKREMKGGDITDIVKYLEDEHSMVFTDMDADIRAGEIKPIGEMTTAEIEALHGAVKMLEAAAKKMETNRVKDDAKVATLFGAVDPKLNDRLKKSYAEKAQDWWAGKKGLAARARYLRFGIEKAETILIDLDGGNPGKWWETFYKPLKGDEVAQKHAFEARIKEYRKIGAEFPEFQKLQDRKAVFVDGIQRTHMELLGIIVNMANEGNYYKMLNGAVKSKLQGWAIDTGKGTYRMDPQVMKRLHEIFPEQSTWKLAQRLIDLAGSNKEALFGARERISGVAPEEVEARTIETPDGTLLQGGYWPIRYAHDLPSRAGPGERGIDLDKKFVPAAFVPSSATKQRTAAVGMMDLNVQKILMSHLYESTHFQTHFEDIVEKARILNRSDVREKLVNTLGLEGYRSLQNWLGYVANEGRLLTTENNAIITAMNRMISNYSTMTLVGNISSAVRQFADASAGFAKMPLHMPLAIAEFAKNPMEAVRFVQENAHEILETDWNYDRDIREMGVRDSTKAVLSFTDRAKHWGLLPTLWTQSMVNVVVFNAAMMKGKGQGLAGDALTDYAKSMVRTTQSAGGAVDMAPIQRATDPGSRALTALASFAPTLNDMFMPRRLTGKEAKESAQRIFFYVFAYGVAQGLLSHRLSPEEQEKRAKAHGGRDNNSLGDEMKWSAIEALKETYGNIPGIGRPMQAIIHGETMGRAGGGEGIVRTGKDVVKWATTNKEWDKKMTKHLADAASIGLPALFPQAAAPLVLQKPFFRVGEAAYEALHGNLDHNAVNAARDVAFTPTGQIGVR